MAWEIRLEASARRQLIRLDPATNVRIVKFLSDRVGVLDSPRQLGRSLTIYRVADYRIVCRMHDKERVVEVLMILHRGQIYRKLARKDN